MPSISQAEEARFDAQDDVRTLARAEEIRSDKSRMTRAMKEAKRQMEALEKLNG